MVDIEPDTLTRVDIEPDTLTTVTGGWTIVETMVMLLVTVKGGNVRVMVATDKLPDMLI